MELDRAKAIAEVAQVIVNSAKVENENMKITGSTGSGFLASAAALPAPGQPRLIKGSAQA